MTLHLLRPEWCWAYIPWGMLVLFLLKKCDLSHALLSICDAHLIPYVIQKRGRHNYRWTLFCTIMSAGLMIFSLSGPTWSRYQAQEFTAAHPRVLLLDLSASMLKHDISPDRLSRAKFNIHRLLHFSGLWGLVVYTSEPFTVSPLTQDGQTMDEWVDTLQPSIMPVMGNRLDVALNASAKLISEAGFQQGEILVLTDKSPSIEAVDTSGMIFNRGIRVSIMPVNASKKSSLEFARFASHSGGQVIDYNDNQPQIRNWLNQNTVSSMQSSSNSQVSSYLDQGRWFLIPAFLFLLPLFQRGAKERLLR